MLLGWEEIIYGKWCELGGWELKPSDTLKVCMSEKLSVDKSHLNKLFHPEKLFSFSGVMCKCEREEQKKITKHWIINVWELSEVMRIFHFAIYTQFRSKLIKEMGGG